MEMYRFEDSTDGTLLKVSTGPLNTKGVTVSIKYLDKLNYVLMDSKEAVRFAEAVVKAAGFDVMLVPLVKNEVSVDRFGSLCCGEGTSEMKVAEGVTLEDLRVVVSNLATIVAFMEKTQEVENRLQVDREEVSELLGINMPKAGDMEGLKALDEIIKRRKGL